MKHYINVLTGEIYETFHEAEIAMENGECVAIHYNKMHTYFLFDMQRFYSEKEWNIMVQNYLAN